jgi:chemotaxis protein CheD
MTEDKNSIAGHFLYPSSLFVSTTRHLITTILGSCVGICLYNEKLKFGGMNHYMLALWNGNCLASPRFGNIANEKLLAELTRQGSTRMHLVAKVFGGANQTTSYNDVGLRNVEVAFEFLDRMEIPVLAQHVGGETGRKIIFDTYTGEVRMKLVQKSPLVSEQK